MTETLRSLSLHQLGGFLISASFLSFGLLACDDEGSPASEPRAGAQGGATAGASGGVSAGAVAGQEAGREAGHEGGAGGDIGGAPPPPPECGPPLEAQIGRMGGTIEVTEGALQGAHLSFPEGALTELVALEGRAQVRALMEGEEQRWGLACLSEALLPEGWAGLTRAVAVYATPEEGRAEREGAARLQSGAQLKLTWSEPLPEGLTSDHLQLMMTPLYRDLDPEALPSSLTLNPVPLVDAKVRLEGREVSFIVDQPGIYQLAYQPSRTSPRERRLSYQAIFGVSMGGGAAATIAARHPERFDFVGGLGGAADWTYLIDYSMRRLFGGFCERAPGESCPGEELADELEHPSTFESWHYSRNGGDFNRDQYVKIFQDISLIFGNPLTFNPESPYLPVGVPSSEISRSRRERCAVECRGDDCEPAEPTVRLERLYDRRYNPQGEHPVVTFCDGEDGGAPGVFDGQVAHEKPFEVALAVDLNNNGRRDAGEPVITQRSEPFEDVGCDGLPNEREEGYHPVYNPDPSGDDFHWRFNPRGTEGDGLYQGAEGAVGLERDDPVAAPIRASELAQLKAGLSRISCVDQPGEPWEDTGLDGVAETTQLDEGGYDWGQGDGHFNYNPNYIRALSHNAAHALYARMPQREGLEGPEAEPAQLPRFWLDGGIRDLFNFAIAGMYLTGRLQGESGAGGAPLRVFNGFKQISDANLLVPTPARDDDMRSLGWHVLMRYGNPEASPDEIEAGDGAHVGTEAQALNRFSSFLWWVSVNWPTLGPHDGSIGDLSDPIYDEVESEGFGGNYTFTVILPPGYELPQNADVRYPVVYLLHGYGQRHRDLAQTNTFFSAMMGSGALQKMIFVYPDGSCGARWVRGDGPECSDGLDNDLDGLIDLEDLGCITPDDDEADCREGSFYTRHAAWEDGREGGRDYEAGFLDMMGYIHANYRTLSPESVRVSSPD